MPGKTIFIVEDDPHIRELLVYNMGQAGFDARAYDRGEKAFEDAVSSPPGLVLLDLMLPGMDGLEVCRRLRRNAATARVPIIMLTARGDEVDRVLGLELGADDYIVKPFSVRETIARVKAVLRRGDTPPQTNVLQIGGLTLDPDSREVRVGAEIIDLSLKEFDLLACLMEHAGRVMTRDRLLRMVWGYQYAGETRTVDVHIRMLRQKIEENPDEPGCIETVRGVGYRFRKPPPLGVN